MRANIPLVRTLLDPTKNDLPPELIGKEFNMKNLWDPQSKQSTTSEEDQLAQHPGRPGVDHTAWLKYIVEKLHR
jgi:hypothetical protein